MAEKVLERNCNLVRNYTHYVMRESDDGGRLFVMSKDGLEVVGAVDVPEAAKLAREAYVIANQDLNSPEGCAGCAFRTECQPMPSFLIRNRGKGKVRVIYPMLISAYDSSFGEGIILEE